MENIDLSHLIHSYSEFNSLDRFLELFFNILDSLIHAASIKRVPMRQKKKQSSKASKLTHAELLNITKHIFNAYLHCYKNGLEMDVWTFDKTALEQLQDQERKNYIDQFSNFIFDLFKLDLAVKQWVVPNVIDYACLNIVTNPNVNELNYHMYLNKAKSDLEKIIKINMDEFIFNKLPAFVRERYHKEDYKNMSKHDFCYNILKNSSKNAQTIKALKHPIDAWSVIENDPITKSVVKLSNTSSQKISIKNLKLIMKAIEMCIHLCIYIEPMYFSQTIFPRLSEQYHSIENIHQKNIIRIFNTYIGKFFSKYKQSYKNSICFIAAKMPTAYFNHIAELMKTEYKSYPLGLHEELTYTTVLSFSKLGDARYTQEWYMYKSDVPLSFSLMTITFNVETNEQLTIVVTTIQSVQHVFDVIAFNGIRTLNNISWKNRLQYAKELITIPTIEVEKISVDTLSKRQKHYVYVCTNGVGYGTKFKSSPNTSRTIKHNKKEFIAEI